jgi:hypothetical protein
VEDVHNFVTTVWDKLDRNDRVWLSLMEARDQEHDKDAWLSKVTDFLQSLNEKYNFQKGLERMLDVTKSYEIRGSLKTNKDTDRWNNHGVSVDVDASTLKAQVFQKTRKMLW